MIRKCVILIDGSNFYFKLKDFHIHNLLSFNFKEFIKFLSNGDKVIFSRYFVGRVRQDGTKHTDKLLASQQKLLVSLKKQGIQYSLGFLLKSDGKLHEKGVDVQIAVDMLVAAYENICDRIILISSDTDLAPAIKKAQTKGKPIEYVGFSHQPSIAMVRFCTSSRILTKENLIKFISP